MSNKKIIEQILKNSKLDNLVKDLIKIGEQIEDNFQARKYTIKLKNGMCFLNFNKKK